jgi:phage-related holin
VEYYVSNEFIEFLTEYKKSGLPQNITAIIKELKDRKWKKEQEEQMTKKGNHST